jgi:ribosome maturation factor RimP
MNTDRVGIEKKFLDLCQPVITDLGLDLYDMDYVVGSKTLRLYIMDRVTKTAVIEDCAKVDRALSEPFEQNPWIPEEITLEVSSPGLYRKLKSFQQFEYAVGQRVLVKFRGPLKEELKTNKIIADLKGIESQSDNEFSLKLEYKDKEIELISNQIIKANLEPEI